MKEAIKMLDNVYRQILDSIEKNPDKSDEAKANHSKAIHVLNTIDELQNELDDL